MAWRILIVVLVLYGVLLVGVAMGQRSLLYYPTHYDIEGPLGPWRVGGEAIGFAREVAAPREVWLMLHGNGGQAAQRGYVLEHVAEEAAVFVLEYPGYGDRAGKPSRESINAAAQAAWLTLRKRFPGVPMGVIGESIGTGPACELAGVAEPPDKIVLWTPYDRLVDVAKERFRWLPVGLLLRDKWDNGAALQAYGGAVEIYAAKQDEVIPIQHARRLHERVPAARWIEMEGGHNSWRWEGVLRVDD
ncbi:alpha/beta hydrolase [Actomonas aquatica]|uniref:Alpha/beta hydrolase n=1 Tax=Actomonas aquatica TaxID=2866162 RepID=A0ABZ1C6X6_9BACT|nr:hypothetical protein [Opitutus sp. WL0086]WRQ87334.1 hypothetical protein K1X11_021175 [Opitutus sp. WL0086]